jgi:Protein of unknown function (DUF2855)
MTTTFIVDRKKLSHTEWVHRDAGLLPEGSVRMKIDAFALTSNNITYAAFGNTMNYWDFFPTGDPATGCIPVWGFADVVESRCPGVAVGERFYGYFPMASDVVLQPVRVSETGFVDGAEHRRALHAIYNQYSRCSTDPGYVPAREAEQALLRPLFITSFLIDDFLADNAFFGAGAVILSSASSKTAYGTAFCLARRRGANAAKIVGLTSPGNLAFTRSLGCYDEVLTYEDVGALPAGVPSVYVDLSGSVTVRASIHAHFGDRLMYSCSVGGTHWESLGSGKGLPGPRPVLFFAPTQGKRRNMEWGAAGFQQRVESAWAAFMESVGDPSRPWLRVVRGDGAVATEATYAALLAGTVDPSEGHVLSV